MDTAFYKSYPAIYEHLKSIPKPDAKFIYGTAGFRMHYDLLPSVFIRVGIIGVLRSMYHKKVLLFTFRLIVGDRSHGNGVPQPRDR